MAGSKAGAAKMKQKMIERFGTEEAWRAWMKENSSKGGKQGHGGGFAWMKENGMDEEIRAAGKKGGTRSRRGKAQ